MSDQITEYSHKNCKSYFQHSPDIGNLWTVVEEAKQALNVIYNEQGYIGNVTIILW